MNRAMLDRRWLAIFGMLCLVLTLGCDGVCTRGTEVGTAAAATLYYPCTITEPLPATTMTSGYTATHFEVNWLAREVAANDFVVLAMTPINPLGMDGRWRDTHISGIARLISLNAGYGPLRGKIDMNRLQVCGHSKGGGGALWAADMLGSLLKSAIVFAPWQEQFTTLDSIRAATMIQAGALDIYATRDMTLAEYDLLPDAISKAYFEYTEADHFAWSVSLGSYHDILAADVVAWMKYYLKEDRSQHAVLSSAADKTTYLWEDHP